MPLENEKGVKMQTIQLPHVIDVLQKLSAEKLRFVYDFISYLIEQEPIKPELKQSAIKQITTEEYEELLQYKKLATFNSFTRAIGKEAENRELTEKELIADLKQTRREVFEEEYGSIQ